MIFGYVGINYKHADQDIRDQIAFTDNQKIDFMQQSGEKGIEQCFVLSTCNRSEVYFFVPEEMTDAPGLFLCHFGGADVHMLINLEGITGNNGRAQSLCQMYCQVRFP